MLENNNNDWYSMTDRALLSLMGNFIRETRLNQNKTQQEVAEAAGMNRTTLSQIENGSGGTMSSFILILRVIGQLHLLEPFQVRRQISPLALAKLEQGKRKRSRQGKKDPGPKSAGK